MKMNGFADAMKNKPNQTQLQTNHPIFKISLKNPYFLDFLYFFLPFYFPFLKGRSSPRKLLSRHLFLVGNIPFSTKPISSTE